MNLVQFLFVAGFIAAAVVLCSLGLCAYWLGDRVGQEMGWWR